jgi:hypothetical protein
LLRIEKATCGVPSSAVITPDSPLMPAIVPVLARTRLPERRSRARSVPSSPATGSADSRPCPPLTRFATAIRSTSAVVVTRPRWLKPEPFSNTSVSAGRPSASQ